ncbi:MAG: ABC transporter permease [Chloroflexota bacterium]|nr:ABC transporter permease [Chloroflexota bacterium]
MNEAGAVRTTVARDTARPGGRRLSIPRGAIGLIVPVLLLLFWQWLVDRGVYTRGQLPEPLDVWRAAGQLNEAGKLWENVRISLVRVGWGFGIGSALALGLGLLVGLSTLADALLSPTIGAFRAIPSLAWVPLLILWMGIGEQPKLTLIAIGAFFPVFTSLVGGIRQIDRKLIEVGYAYGLRRLALARSIVLPAALPSLLTGLRIGLAQAWLFLVAAELIGAFSGLGFLLTDGQNAGRADIILLSIISLALIGKLTDLLLQWAERWLLRWSDTYR